MPNPTSTHTEGVMERLKALAAELSGFDTAELVETKTFLELGFDSLFLTQLASAFQNAFGLKITFRQLFDELPTLAALAQHIEKHKPAQAAAPVAKAAALVPATPSVPAPAPVAAAVAPAVALPQILMQALAPMPQPSGALHALMAEQLQLMSRQLQLLSANRAFAPAQVAAPVAAVVQAPPAPVAAAAAAPQAAPTETVALPKGFGPQVSREDKSITPRQRAHVDRLIASYNAKTAGSKTLAQAHRAHHADPRTAAGFNRLWKEIVYPIVIERSRGCHLFDVDGNTYIDMLNGFGPNYLGHSTPFVCEALKAQIDKGIEVGPQTPLAGETAHLFCEMTGMDRVSFVNTGSEAVQAVIRLSRTTTGRNKIVLFSGDYHGNFDEVLVRGTKSASGRRTMPLAPGIPMRAVEDVIVLDYGSDEALAVIKANASDIACVLVEPVQSRKPELQPRAFLHALRTLTEQEDIVLVFDEVITGFRLCPGGAQEFYGVKADLATYGKIIAGGMPIGVVAGRARFMDTFDGGMWQYGDDSYPSAGVTFFAGTFVRHPLAIAAVNATLKYLKAAGPSLQEGVNRRTARLAGELNTFFQERGVKIAIPHCGSQMFVRVQEENELATLVFYHLRNRGIHMLEGFPSYMTAAHTDEDVDAYIAAFKDSIFEMQDDGLLPRPAGETTLPGNWRRRLPLTDGQREIWVGTQMGEMASCAFNESDSIHIDGKLDGDRFRHAVLETLAGQEAFKLRFAADGSAQWVDREAKFEMPVADLSGLDPRSVDTQLEARLTQEALTPFDLERGPLVRARLFKLAAERHVFVIYCHHIVFDGYSAELVVREIMERYAASVTGKVAPANATVPYSLYVHRAAGLNSKDKAAASFAYWTHIFGDELPPPLELVTDRPRASLRGYRGGTVHRALDPALSNALRTVAKSHGVSQHALMLSSFLALLSRLSAQEDMVVGIPAAGQAALELDTVGYCVNTLPVRTQPTYEKPFTTFMAETQKAVLDAFEHQETSLGSLIKSLGIPRDPSRLPLVEVIFNYSRYFSALTAPGCTIASRENRREAVYYDLFFNIVEAKGQLVIDWDYSKELFDESTIERWVDHFVELLGGIVRNPHSEIGNLSLMSEHESAVAEAGWPSKT